MTQASRPDGEWHTLSDAAFASGVDTRTLHSMCNDGTIDYRADDNGTWLVSLPHLLGYLRRITGSERKPFAVRAVEYDELLGHLARMEKKLDTILEGNISMTAADDRIEADVTSLKATLTGVQGVISTLNSTVDALKAAAAAGQPPSDQTLSDLDDITSQFGALVPPAPADPTTPPVDTTPTDPSTPVDTGATGAGDTDVPPADDSPQPVDGTDPTSGGAIVGDPSSASDTPASVPDPADLVGQPAPSSAQPQSP